jgi:hypothetical protein
MEQYDSWHDRAVFHFLKEAKDRKGYINSINKALKLNGHLIIATIALKVPPKRSGLPVTRYSRKTLQNELGDNFNLVKAIVEAHMRPSGERQKFIFCRFIKKA